MSKSISQLDTEAIAHTTDLFEVAVADAQSATGYASGKMSAEVIAEGMLNNFTYPTAMPNMQNKTITGAINQMLANFAPVYDATATYSKDDVVTYNGQLYKANQDISVAEAWDSTHWTAIVVKQISGNQHDYSTTEQVVGTWIDGSTLYEKSFYATGTFSNGTQYSVDTGILHDDLGEIVESNGNMFSTDVILPLNFYLSANEYTRMFIAVGTTGQNVSVEIYSKSFNFTKYIITIRYTKSTS